MSDHVKQPEPGEYWQHHGELKNDRVYFIGRTPDGEMVWQCEGDTIEAGNLDWSGWENLPDCDGWNWQPEVFPQYWTTNADESTFAYVVRCGPRKIGDWYCVMKDGASGPKLDFFKWSTEGRTRITKEQAEALVAKTNETPAVDAGYELLPEGTLIQPGDEYLAPDGVWRQTGAIGYNTTRYSPPKYRRKIPVDLNPRLVPVRLWCLYERGNKTGHMYVFANTEPPVGSGIKYSEIRSDGVGGWVIEVNP